MKADYRLIIATQRRIEFIECTQCCMLTHDILSVFMGNVNIRVSEALDVKVTRCLYDVHWTKHTFQVSLEAFIQVARIFK